MKLLVITLSCLFLCLNAFATATLGITCYSEDQVLRVNYSDTDVRPSDNKSLKGMANLTVTHNGEGVFLSTSEFLYAKEPLFSGTDTLEQWYFFVGEDTPAIYVNPEVSVTEGQFYGSITVDGKVYFEGQDLDCVLER